MHCYFFCFLLSAEFFYNQFFCFLNLSVIQSRVKNSLNLDQAGHYVGPDLGLNCF